MVAVRCGIAIVVPARRNIDKKRMAYSGTMRSIRTDTMRLNRYTNVQVPT
jgi:hypothetical protein